MISQKGERNKMAKNMTVELDSRVVQLKVEMDNLVEDIRGLEYEVVELGEVFKVRQEQLRDRFEEKEYLLRSKKEKLQMQLRELFEQVPQSETKTQRKVKLLNGDVIIKKPKADFEKDADKLLKWADFKKGLVSTEYGIVDVETGETIKIDGLVPIIKAAELEIKY